MCVHCSRQRALVLEVEDLPWIDATSEACLAALVQQLPGLPILLLVTYRSGYQPPWMNKSYATQLTLQPLDTQDSEHVVQAALAGRHAPHDLIQTFIRTAEGNPFFLEELARAVREQGDHRPTLAVPETIQAVLTARIDRLPPDAKRLLQMAAVVGKEVPLALLQAIVDLPETLLDQRLTYLQGVEFLYNTHLVPEPAYAFKHALTQEVAYQSLLRRTRRQIHQHIARVLEAQFPEIMEAQPELLAHHYAEAGLLPQAVAYGHRAGKAARERFALAEAVDYLTTALEWLAGLPDSPERARQELQVQLTLADILASLKGYAAPEAERHLVRARQLCEHLGETSLPYLSVLRGLSRAYYTRGDLPQAHEVCEALLRLAQDQDDPAPLLGAHRGLGIILHLRGEFSKARHHFEQNLTLRERIPQRQLDYQLSVHPATDFGVLAQTLWMLGYPDQALESSKVSLTLHRNASFSDSTANALNFAGMVRLFRREPRSAWALNEEAVALMTEHGLALQRARGITQQGIALSRQGQHDAGLAQIEAGMTAFRDTGSGGALTIFLGWLAEAYGRAGRFEAAQSTLTEAMGCVDKGGECVYEAELYRLQGELLLHQTTRDERQAETWFLQALDVARRQQAKSWELRAATSLARLWQQQDKCAEACALLDSVYRWFTEGFDTADLQEAKMLLEELQG